MNAARPLVVALLFLALAPPARATDPLPMEVRLAQLEEKVEELEAVADQARPLLWLVGGVLVGGAGAIGATYSVTRRAADKAVEAAVGRKTRELQRLVEEQDLADLVRKQRALLIVGPDGNEGLELLLRADGWRKLSTVTVEEGARDTLVAAVKAGETADLVVFDRLPERSLVDFCQRLSPRDRRFACFTRTPYRDLPNDVRDALVFGNTPDQALYWIEAAALRQERARRRRDPAAPASV